MDSNLIFGLSAPLFWLILSAFLGVVEVSTVAFFALPFAFGAAVTALTAWIVSPSIATQIWIFIITSTVSLVGIQYWFRGWQKKKMQEGGLQSNVDALIGKQCVVTARIKGELQRGSVKVGGDVWSAIATDGGEFEEGEVVYIHKVDGVKLLVGSNPPQA